MAETKSMDLNIAGMTCNHCRMAVERALKNVDGVTGASVDLAAGKAKVTYDPAKAGYTDMSKAVEEAGYSASQG